MSAVSSSLNALSRSSPTFFQFYAGVVQLLLDISQLFLSLRQVCVSVILLFNGAVALFTDYLQFRIGAIQLRLDTCQLVVAFCQRATGHVEFGQGRVSFGLKFVALCRVERIGKCPTGLVAFRNCGVASGLGFSQFFIQIVQNHLVSGPLLTQLRLFFPYSFQPCAFGIQFSQRSLKLLLFVFQIGFQFSNSLI